MMINFTCGTHYLSGLCNNKQKNILFKLFFSLPNYKKKQLGGEREWGMETREKKEGKLY